MKKKNILLPVSVLIVILAIAIMVFFFSGKKEGEEETVSLETLRNATVQIHVGETYGSGVIIKKTEEKLVIVTCSHLMEGYDQGIITLVSGDTVFGDVVSLNTENDLCFLEVLSEYIDANLYDEISVANQDEKAYNSVAEGDKLILLGSVQGVGANEISGELLSKEYFVPEYNMNMLYLYCDVTPGMSGAGTYDEQGNLIGIVDAGSDTSEALCIDIMTIKSEMEEIYNDKD